MINKMNPTVKALWVDALRSGEYRQGKGQLHNGTTGEYCCLGVLCSLYIQHTGKGDWVHPDNSLTVFKSREGMNECFPPEEVQYWADLYCNDPRIMPSTDPRNDSFGTPAAVSHVNDRLGLTFAEIADLIEENL